MQGDLSTDFTIGKVLVGPVTDADLLNRNRRIGHLGENQCDRRTGIEGHRVQDDRRVVGKHDGTVAGDRDALGEAQLLSGVHHAGDRTSGRNDRFDPLVAQRPDRIAHGGGHDVGSVDEGSVDVERDEFGRERQAIGSKTLPMSGTKAAGIRTDPSAC